MPKIDWSWVLAVGWPVVVAVPGFIAFWWQWWDRVHADKARAPFVEIRAAYGLGIKDQDGWVPAQFLVRNDTDVPIIITELKVLRPRGVRIAMNQRTSTGVTPDLGRMGSTVTVKWRCEPKLHNGRGGETWSAQTLGFFGSTERSMSDVHVSIRATFSEMSATRRRSKTIVISDAMKLPLATIIKRD